MPVEVENQTITHCPICFERVRFRYSIRRFTPAFEILRCPACHLEMQAVIPRNPVNLYDAEYYSGRAEYSYRDERSREQFDRYVWNARLKHIRKFIPPPADFCDVGCAFGGLVAAAQDAGYRARGLDISPYAVAAGRERGLDLRTGMLEPEALPSKSVDVLTMIEVFEHLPDPQSAMRALSAAVRPGGLVVIQTANFQGRQARRAGADYHYYLPGHFFYYSTHNLRLLFNRFGFNEIHFFRPVEFGLLPKLLKSRGDFQSVSDYLRWIRIAWYHYSGKLAWGDYSHTSSMVMYALKNR